MGAKLAKNFRGDAAITDETQSPISELNIDCLEELFTWMSLADLFAFRRTCKRYKQAVDHYIRTYYPAIGTVYISDRNLVKFLCFGTNTLVKKIVLNVHRRTISRDHINRIKDTLRQVEDLEIMFLKFNGDFYSDFLQFCPNLKNLHIQYRDTLKIGTGNKWLLRHYPKLEFVTFFDIGQNFNTVKRVEMKRFLKLNTNIKRFGASAKFFLRHRKLFCKPNNIFDDLYILIDNCFEATMIQLFRFLDTLKEHRYYTRIDSNGTPTKNAIRLLWYIENFEVFHMNYIPAVFPMLPDLKELRFLHGLPAYLTMETTIDSNAQIKSKNITYVDLERATMDQVLPFIQNNAQLEYIRIETLKVGIHFKKNVIDLRAINTEREKLNDACKTEILVRHNIFMATKRALMQTDFSLIELKPLHAYYVTTARDEHFGRFSFSLFFN